MGLFSRKGAQRPETAAPAPSQPRRRTVVIVDDDMTISDLEETVFMGRDWRVLTAYDGMGALRLVNDHRPELVLLDLMLPDVPGENVLDAIKSGRLPSKVIVVTGRYVTKKDFERFSGTVVWVLRKPYPINDLRALIDWFEGGALQTPKLSSVGDV
ncbi:MAG TPA: response regulator [Candidatus Thermoplasmatota archaeon]